MKTNSKENKKTKTSKNNTLENLFTDSTTHPIKLKDSKCMNESVKIIRTKFQLHECSSNFCAFSQNDKLLFVSYNTKHVALARRFLYI